MTRIGRKVLKLIHKVCNRIIVRNLMDMNSEELDEVFESARLIQCRAAIAKQMQKQACGDDNYPSKGGSN